MSILVDSHVALWWLEDHKRLGSECKNLLVESDVFFSVVTPWELGIKKALGRIDFPDGMSEALLSSGFRCLPIDYEHAERAPTLEPFHKDPFDRMLVAQAQIEGLRLSTADKQLHDYEVLILDAEV